MVSSSLNANDLIGNIFNNTSFGFWILIAAIIILTSLCFFGMSYFLKKININRIQIVEFFIGVIWFFIFYLFLFIFNNNFFNHSFITKIFLSTWYLTITFFIIFIFGSLYSWLGFSITVFIFLFLPFKPIFSIYPATDSADYLQLRLTSAIFLILIFSIIFSSLYLFKKIKIIPQILRVGKSIRISIGYFFLYYVLGIIIIAINNHNLVRSSALWLFLLITFSILTLIICFLIKKYFENHYRFEYENHYLKKHILDNHYLQNEILKTIINKKGNVYGYLGIIQRNDYFININSYDANEIVNKLSEYFKNIIIYANDDYQLCFYLPINTLKNNVIIDSLEFEKHLNLRGLQYFLNNMNKMNKKLNIKLSIMGYHNENLEILNNFISDPKYKYSFEEIKPNIFLFNLKSNIERKNYLRIISSLYKQKKYDDLIENNYLQIENNNKTVGYFLETFSKIRQNSNLFIKTNKDVIFRHLSFVAVQDFLNNYIEDQTLFLILTKEFLRNSLSWENFEQLFSEKLQNSRIKICLLINLKHLFYDTNKLLELILFFKKKSFIKFGIYNWDFSKENIKILTLINFNYLILSKELTELILRDEKRGIKIYEKLNSVLKAKKIKIIFNNQHLSNEFLEKFKKNNPNIYYINYNIFSLQNVVEHNRIENQI